MLAKLRTYALLGIDAVPVEVEVDAAAGTPKTVFFGHNTPVTAPTQAEELGRAEGKRPAIPWQVR
jgi:hypothetical protein